MQHKGAESLCACRITHAHADKYSLEPVSYIHREEVRVCVLELSRNPGQGEGPQVNVAGGVIPSPALVPDVVVANVNREPPEMSAYPQAQDAPVT